MSSISGGVAAAYGYGFQYLATIEALLDQLETDDRDFLLTTEDPRDDVIDYSISRSDRLLVVAQAKASVDGADGQSLTPAVILDVAVRMLDRQADRYIIRTNRRVSPAAENLLDEISSLVPGLKMSEIVPRLSRHLRPSSIEILKKLTPAAAERISRLRVVSSTASIDEFATDVAARIKDLRRRDARGLGDESASVLLGYLVAEILYRSGRRTGRALSRVDADRLLGRSERSLAYAVGAYDWGNPIGPFPVLDSVARPGLLNDLLTVFAGPRVRRDARSTVLLGLSGIGKSALAASFAELTAAWYDRLVWIDASSNQTVRNQIAALLGPASQKQPDAELSEVFRERLGSDAASWLLVFDNAPDAATVTAWLPGRGHVDVIATSTNSTAWNSWTPITVSPMSDEEAMDLALTRLSLHNPSTTERDQAAILVRALENWPLAIELACAFLAQSGRLLDLADEYLRRLKSHVVDDPTLVPSEYRSHPTLLQAILVSLAEVESRDQDAQRLRSWDLLQVLAYLPPRAAPLGLAGRTALDLTRFRTEGRDAGEDKVEAELEVDDAIRGLTSASLVQRTHTPVGDHIRSNAIVLDIVRQLHSDRERALALILLQHTAGDDLRDALDHERYALASTLASSGHDVVAHAEPAGMLTFEGVLLTGNLASLKTAQGDYRAALWLLNAELEMLDRSEELAPMLRAKIFAGVLVAQMHTNADSSSMADTIESALAAAESAAATGAFDEREVGQIGQQVLEVVAVLRELSEPQLSVVKDLESWHHRCLALMPDGDHGEQLREARMALGRHGNDDAATLRFFESALNQAAPGRERIDLLVHKAETLASLHRYDSAAAAFGEAINESQNMGLGFGPIWTSLINAWRTAGYYLLGGVGPMEAVAEAFCERLDSLTGDAATPTDPSDAARLALCRAMTGARRYPVDAVSAQLANLGDLPRSSHLMRETAGDRDAARACREIVEIRRRLGGAAVHTMTGWSVTSGVAPFTTYFIAVPSETLNLIAGMASTSLLTGSWVTHESGVGLVIADPVSAVIWAHRIQTGWFPAPELPPVRGTARLRERITDDTTSTFADMVVLTDKDPQAIRPEDFNGPTVMVLGRSSLDESAAGND